MMTKQQLLKIVEAANGEPVQHSERAMAVPASERALFERFELFAECMVATARQMKDPKTRDAVVHLVEHVDMTVKAWCED